MHPHSTGTNRRNRHTGAHNRHSGVINRHTGGIRIVNDNSQRRGTISLLSVFAIFACVLCVALVVNSAYMAKTRQHNRQCAEAAALAACRSLLCDDMLYRDVREFEVEGRIEDCKDAALTVTSWYSRQQGSPLVDRDQIYVAHRSFDSHGNPSQLLTGTLFPNHVAIAVGSGRGRDSANHAMLLGNAAAMPRATYQTRVAAMMDNRIVGFQPSNSVAVPLAPFAIPDDPQRTVTGCGSTDIESDEGQDQWAWRESNSQSQSGSQLQREADRIPEITLILKPGQQQAVAGHLLPVCAVSGAAPTGTLSEQLQLGVSVNDLSAAGQTELRFPCDSVCQECRSTDIQTVAAGMQSLVGQMRIFPVTFIRTDTSDANDAEGDSTEAVRITRVVAARFMEVQDRSTEIQVVLQPCVMSTATALIDPAVGDSFSNPYIWQIRLVK
jgi:hypothetical protein